MAEYININNFINYIKETFKDRSYEFEVFATDILSFYFNINAEIIYITKGGGDQGIDSIVIPQKSEHYIDRYYYVLQISLGPKTIKSLKKFLNQNPHDSYPNLIPENAKIKRIVLTLGSTPEIEGTDVISKTHFAQLILSIGIQYGLINENTFNDNYLANIERRAALWNIIHQSADGDPITENYFQILSVNQALIKQEVFNLPIDIMKIVDKRVEQVLDLTTPRNKSKYLARVFSNLNLETVRDKAKRDLILAVGAMLNYNFKDFEIVPTKRYLSVKKINNTGKKNVVAYFTWNYASPSAKLTSFGFNCPFEKVKELDEKIQPKPPVDMPKSYNYLKYPVNTFLVNPDIVDDKSIINHLMLKSIEHVSNRELQ